MNTSGAPAFIINTAGHFHWDPQSLIGRQGLRWGDQLIFMPFNGHQHCFVLNRTCYQIVSGARFSYDSKNAILTLPSVAAENFKFRLVLYGPSSFEQEERGRFVLVAEEGTFRINQTTSFGSFLERGDELWLGFNKICCALPVSSEGDFFLPHPLLAQDSFLQSDLPLIISGERGTGKRHLATLVHQRSGRRGPCLEIKTMDDLVAASKLHGTTLVVRMSLPKIWPKMKHLALPHGHHHPQARLIVIYDFPLAADDFFPPEILDFLSQGQRICLAPLRQRPTLLNAYCRHFAQHYHLTFTARLLDWYAHYDWPGNWRELENHLQLKRQSARGAKIDFDDLDAGLIPHSAQARNDFLMGRPWPLKYWAQQYLAQIFFAVGNKYRPTAQLLAVSENTVRRMLRNDAK